LHYIISDMPSMMELVVIYLTVLVAVQAVRKTGCTFKASKPSDLVAAKVTLIKIILIKNIVALAKKRSTLIIPTRHNVGPMVSQTESK